MMHHSLHRRELLRRMNAHPVIAGRRDVHRNLVAPGNLKPVPYQPLHGEWSIQTARGHPVEKLVAEDAGDFLRRIGVKVSDDAEVKLLLELGSAPAGFRTVVDTGRIEVHAADAESLWAGWVSLEHEMRRSGRPILTPGEV